MCANTLWPLSSSTRNMAFGSDSRIVPSSTMASSLGLGRAFSSDVSFGNAGLGHDGGPGGAEPFGESESKRAWTDRPVNRPGNNASGAISHFQWRGPPEFPTGVLVPPCRQFAPEAGGRRLQAAEVRRAAEMEAPGDRLVRGTVAEVRRLDDRSG